MKVHQINEAKKLPELPKDLLKKVNKVGLLTGSAVFGGWKKGSDIDYIMVKEKGLYKELRKYMSDAAGSVDDGSTFRAYYARSGDYILNFIMVNDVKYFDAWKKAHELMMDMVNNSKMFKKLMKEKLPRVRQFQLLRDIFGWKSYEDDNEEDYFQNFDETCF